MPSKSGLCNLVITYTHRHDRNPKPTSIMTPPTIDAPQIDPNFLCSAWIDSHFPFSQLSGAQPPLPPPPLGNTLPRPPSLSSDGFESASTESHGDPYKGFHRVRNVPPQFSSPPDHTGDGDGGGGGGDGDGDGDGAAAEPTRVPPEPQPAQSSVGSFVNRLNTGPSSSSSKRKAKSRESSPSKGGAACSTLSDTRHKRMALELAEPSGFLGTPDPTKHRPSDPAMPECVQRLLHRLSPGQLGAGCMPQTPAIDALLQHSFAHEFLAPYHRLAVSDADAPAALDLVNAAILAHRTCLYNSRHSEDESAWYPVVRRLLCVDDDDDGGLIPLLPVAGAPPDEDDFLQTVDATTKPTTSALPPVANTTLDFLLVFNDRATIKRAWREGLRTNAFADPTLHGKLVALGVKVESAVSQTDAEYHLAVCGMKTLHLARLLAGTEWAPANPCRMAVGLAVCAHVWSMHVTYWRADGAMVTHGPVCVGATDTLYGTMNVVRWVWLFKRWARTEAWGEWKRLVEEAAV